MNHKLLAGGLGALAVAGLVGGGTFASWTDYDTITGNETEAGHLVLDTDSTGTINNVGAQAIAPGEFRTIDFFVASADLDGVPDADLSMVFENLVEKDNGCASQSEDDLDATCGDPGVGEGEFSQQGYVRIRWTDPAPTSQITFAGNSCAAPSGYVNAHGYAPANNNDPTVYPRLGSLANVDIPLETLAGDQGVCVRIDLGLDVNATDLVQTDATTFDLTFDLAQ
jgi:predicted ribosomally synthesized peptide with SipW-like signal peptide